MSADISYIGATCEEWVPAYSTALDVMRYYLEAVLEESEVMRNDLFFKRILQNARDLNYFNLKECRDTTLIEVAQALIDLADPSNPFWTTNNINPKTSFRKWRRSLGVSNVDDPETWEEVYQATAKKIGEGLIIAVQHRAMMKDSIPPQERLCWLLRERAKSILEELSRETLPLRTRETVQMIASARKYPWLRNWTYLDAH